MNLNGLNKNALNSTINFPEEYRSRIIKIAFLAYQSTQDSSKLLDDFSQDTTVPKDQLYEVLGVYIFILRLFLECADTEFMEKLTEIGFPSSFLENLPIISNREEVLGKLSNYNNYKHISTFKWKIDISLSNSTIVKKAPTPVIFCIELKNGEKYTIEVDVKVFHKLRLNVALLLKEINDFK